MRMKIQVTRKYGIQQKQCYVKRKAYNDVRKYHNK